MSSIPKAKIAIDPRVDGLRTLMDGVAGEFGQDEWVALDYQVPLDIHIQTVTLRWVGCEAGDYGFMVVLHPGGATNPTEAMAVDDTTLEVPADKAPYYAAALAVEFWDADEDVLVERRRIASVDGTTVTLEEGVSSAHGVDANIKCVIGAYSPCVGADNCQAGMRLIGTSFGEIRSEHEFTEKIAAGLVIGCRFHGADVSVTRKVAVNFRFRMCDGSCGQ